MSEARALTNLVGNGVATIVVAKWEGALDEDRMRRHLNQETDEEADDPEAVLVADEIDREPHIPAGPAAERHRPTSEAGAAHEQTRTAGLER